MVKGVCLDVPTVLVLNRRTVCGYGSIFPGAINIFVASFKLGFVFSPENLFGESIQHRVGSTLTFFSSY